MFKIVIWKKKEDCENGNPSYTDKSHYTFKEARNEAIREMRKHNYYQIEVIGQNERVHYIIHNDEYDYLENYL